MFVTNINLPAQGSHIPFRGLLATHYPSSAVIHSRASLTSLYRPRRIRLRSSNFIFFPQQLRFSTSLERTTHNTPLPLLFHTLHTLIRRTRHSKWRSSMTPINRTSSLRRMLATVCNSNKVPHHRKVCSLPKLDSNKVARKAVLLPLSNNKEARRAAASAAMRRPHFGKSSYTHFCPVSPPSSAHCFRP